jgi:imidazolonepropionase-like amidohydrolase
MSSRGIRLALWLAASVAGTSLAAAPDSGSLTAHCGTLIDGVSDQPLRDRSVIIRNGRVTAIEAGRVKDRGAVLDLREHTCLPGLIDMHTHLTDVPEDTADLRVYFRRSAEEQARLARANAEATVRAGFTAVRNVGTYVAWADRALRDAIDRGEVIGPRVQASGFYLTIPGGGGDLVVPGPRPDGDGPRFHAGVARGPEQFRKRAREAIEGGADVIKVIASGAVLAYGGVPGEPEMTREEIAAVVREAHAAGLKVAAHAHGAQSIKDAILAGADTIEHASLIDDAGIELARQRQVALSMDIYNGDYIDTEGRRQKWPEEFLRKNEETTAVQRLAFARAHAAGVPIVYGTDSAVYPHGLNARQFRFMVANGMTPMEAIKSATSVAAKYMGWADRVGQLTAGRYGDLIAVKCNPLADITCLERPMIVVKGGKRVSEVGQ